MTSESTNLSHAGVQAEVYRNAGHNGSPGHTPKEPSKQSKRELDAVSKRELDAVALGGSKHPSVAPVPRLALNVKDACAAVGVSWDVWREHIEPDVRLVRIGARKLVPVSELERWLAEHAETMLERR